MHTKQSPKLTSNALSALLQLSSPALPIGGYSYSQGFEAAVEARVVTDEASALSWISQQLTLVMAQCEAPIWLLLFQCWADQDSAAVVHWNTWFHASRETQEVRLETEQMGWSLARLIRDMAWGTPQARQHLLDSNKLTYPMAHSFAAHALDISPDQGLTAYLFAWLENQIMAAIKTVPLGQVAGQRILNQLRQLIPAILDEAQQRATSTPPRVYTLAPQFAILSSRHETQHFRLFRS